jgi:hypothetical protein
VFVCVCGAAGGGRGGGGGGGGTVEGIAIRVVKNLHAQTHAPTPTWTRTDAPTLTNTHIRPHTLNASNTLQHPAVLL